MKTKRQTSPWALGRWKLLSVLIALAAVAPLGQGAVSKAHKRHAIVYMSDGTSYEGIVQLSMGKDFSMLRLPPKASDKSTDNAPRIKDVKRHTGRNKIFTFNVNVVKEMTFSPRKTEYPKKFVIINMSNKNEKVEKKRFGLPYPVLKPKCTVVFNSGETEVGVIRSRAMYIQIKDPDTGMLMSTKKVVIRSKYSGEPGQSIDDLVRVKRIKMLDEGDKITRNMEIDFRSFKWDSTDSDNRVLALSKGTLSRVLVNKDADDKKVRVHSTLGENVYLAAKVKGKWVAGWPAEGTKRTKLFTSVETELLKVNDYYNEKKLLGIISTNRDRDITALVRLRRDIPNPEFALKWAKAVGGGFEMGADGKLAEFYRLGIWRFVRDNKTGKIALVDRGSFMRIKIDLEDKTPEIGICPDLWPVVIKDGKLIVGNNNNTKGSPS